VDNVCVVAFAQRAKPIAVVVPDENALRAFVEKRGIANRHTDLAELVIDQNVKDAVLKELLVAGKAVGLQGIELISGVVLAYEAWTPENGLVTAAQKLSRRKIAELYAKEIRDVFAKTE